jgi:hypothetical protein
VAEEEKTLKNGRDVDVMFRDPASVQEFRARYSCSETANVARYQG